MALDSLPGEIVVPTRDEEVEKIKRDRRVRIPDLDPADPNLDADARVLADALLPLYAGIKIAGQNGVLEDATGDAAVAQWGEREGVDGPNPAIGASGSVRVGASVGGTDIQIGDELLHEPTGNSYKVTKSRTYQDGDPCPVTGVSTGPQTNLAAGAVLKWKSPRPGSTNTATVGAQTNGAGLSGGHQAETSGEYQLRIRDAKKNKAASGNDADYQDTASKTQDVGIQKVFTWPTITGAGTTALSATVQPSRPGGSRIPNADQIATIEAHVVGIMPADDGAYYCLLAEEDADIVYRVTWDRDAAGWADIVPWPPYYAAAGTPAAVVVSAAASATSFTLAAADYTGIAQPQAGQTIAFYDTDGFTFREKRLLSVAGSGPWVVTVDVSNAVSDTEYTPVVGQRAMPWSESLGQLLPNLFDYFDHLGPGEQVAVFYDEGRRQRRQPQAPKEWPHTLTRKGLEAAIDIGEVEDGDVVEGDGTAPSVGSAGSLAYVLKLRWVSVFPE